jgi:hypothetical protein
MCAGGNGGAIVSDDAGRLMVPSAVCMLRSVLLKPAIIRR